MQNEQCNKDKPVETSLFGGMDPQELEAAFSLFNEASRQLSSAYAELQQQVGSLTTQLEIANGNLRRELEEKAILSRRLGLLLERLPGGVLELDGAGRVIQMNPAAVRLLERDLSGTEWMAFQSAAFLATPEADLWLFNSSFGERRYSMVASDVPEEGLRLLLIHDLTEAWELQQALTRNQRLVAMGEMSAGLAHQLRTPLATALLYAGHLGKQGLADEDRCRFSGKLMERLQHLEALIGNMLRFVRGQKPSSAIVPLRPLLDEAVQMVMPGMERAGVKMICDFQLQEGDAVKVDHKEFVGAIVNLLENALNASVASSQIRLQAMHHLRGLVIVVRDEGCGMSPEVRARLFEPFFTTRKEGTGLGLAIVRNLLELYGGSIEVESQQGVGSTFTVCLPDVKAVTKV